MALLDTFRPEFEAQALNTIKAPPPPPGPGVFHNFASSAGNAFMRGMAETARAGSMALAAVPVAIDALDLKDNFSGERVADRYFKWHDETFQRAVDYWTPRPDDVGAAGQIVGSLGAGLVQFFANPALMVGTAQLSTAEDLVRKGVDPGASLVAGDIAGLSTVAGIGLPIFGRTLGQRIAAGAVGNLATNIPEAALKRAVVNAAGSPEAAAQFDPWDVQARIVDVLMGAAFGAKAHMDARTRDALMVMNAAKHMESAALPNRGTDAELTQGVDNLRTAVDQMLRGEPVEVAQLRPPPEVAAAIDLDSRIQSLQAQREQLISAAGDLADKGDIAATRRKLALLEQNRPADSEQAIKELAKSLQQSDGVSYKAALSKAKKLVEQQVADFTAQQASLQAAIDRNASAQQATDRLNVLDRELSRLQAERDRLPFSASLSPISAAARSVFGGDVHPARVEVADFFDSILPQQAKPIATPDMATAAPRPEPDTTQPGPPSVSADESGRSGTFAARLKQALDERNVTVEAGDRSQAGGEAGARVITIADMPEADFAMKHGAPREDVLAHEFAHTYWAGATATPNFKDPANAPLRTEMRAASREFRPYVWEVAAKHAAKTDELMADAMAFWIKHPERRAEFPLIDKMMRGYDAGDLVRTFPDPRPPQRFADDLKLPTGEFDATTGEPVYASANDIVARAAADAERVKATAQNLAETAAACLLGSV